MKANVATMVEEKKVILEILDEFFLKKHVSYKQITFLEQLLKLYFRKLSSPKIFFLPPLPPDFLDELQQSVIFENIKELHQGKMDLIVSFNNFFNFNSSYQEFEKQLETFKNHLSPKGKILLEIELPNESFFSPQIEERKKENGEIISLQSSNINFLNLTKQFTFTKKIENKIISISLNYKTYTLFEIQTMAEKVGLKIKEIYYPYSLSRLSDELLEKSALFLLET